MCTVFAALLSEIIFREFGATFSMQHTWVWVCSLAVVTMATPGQSVPKKYDSDGGFLPSSSSFYQDQVAMETQSVNISQRSDVSEPNAVEQRPQEPRFGFAFPNGMQNMGQGNSVYPGYSGQINLDLGGLILGAIVGLGAVFILPKIIHVFANTHDHYKRSEEDGVSKVMEVLRKVDDTLAKYNIDSSSCVQRAVCSYVKSSAANVKEGKATNMDALIDIASSNSIMGFMLDGSTIKKAVDKGRNGDNCGQVYAKCPFNKDVVFAAVKGLIGEQLIKE